MNLSSELTVEIVCLLLRARLARRAMIHMCVYIYVYIRFLRRQRHNYFTYRDKVDLYFCENVHLIFTFVKMSTQPVDIFTKVKINFIASGTTCVPHDDSISEKPAPLLWNTHSHRTFHFLRMWWDLWQVSATVVDNCCTHFSATVVDSWICKNSPASYRVAKIHWIL